MEEKDEVSIFQSIQCTTSSQEITIKVTNGLPSTTLFYTDPFANKGTVPLSNRNELLPGQTSYVHTTSTTCEFDGGFTMTSHDLTISFNVVYGPASISCNQPLQIQSISTAGFLTGTNSETYLLPHPNIHIRLYQGIEANDQGGFIIPLSIIPPRKKNTSIHRCNTQDFSNSMFGPNVRTLEQIENAFGKEYADFTGGQLQRFVDLWTRFWIHPSACSPLPKSDARLLQFLKKYIYSASTDGPLQMWLPQLQLQPDTNPPVYLLSGYHKMPFVNRCDWIRDTVNQFLLLLATGAHFVFISAADDLPNESRPVTPLDIAFKKSGLITRADPANSHYEKFVMDVGIPNKMGDYYLDIREDFSPPECALLLAFLVGRTVNQQQIPPHSYNTFVQLEGWPFFVISNRHDADFKNFDQTKWNISTYGACPYSEKRATTIFIAPQSFTPQVFQTTGMMPYVGAYASPGIDGIPVPPPWLDTSLFIVPSDTSPLPERFISCL